MRDRAEEEHWDNLQAMFGQQEAAGTVAFTDARLLLLPIRSLTSHHQWVTSQYALERLDRDLQLAGYPARLPLAELAPAPGQALGTRSGQVFLEELTFTVTENPAAAAVAAATAPLLMHETARRRLAGQFLILHDDNKTSKNLWYEETLPPDTLFYFLALARPGHEGDLEYLRTAPTGLRPYLQVGGNETVGQG